MFSIVLVYPLLILPVFSDAWLEMWTKCFAVEGRGRKTVDKERQTSRHWPPGELDAYWDDWLLTLWPPPLRGYGCQTELRPSFEISDIRVLWRSALSVRVPGCQKLQMTA